MSGNGAAGLFHPAGAATMVTGGTPNETISTGEISSLPGSGQGV